MKGATEQNVHYLPGEFVSIHAPMKGATSINGVDISSYQGFNPRSHEGSDWMTKDINVYWLSFNPRSHEGSDVLSDKNQ